MRKEWKTEPLGEVCEFQRGLTYAKGDEVEVSSNVVLRATNIDLVSNLLNFDELKYINDEVVVPESKKVKKGSLMICTASGSKSHLGKVAFIDDDYGYAFGGFMGMVTPTNGLLPKYLFHLMTSDAYKDFIGELSDGANINNLKFDDLRKFQVPYPSPPEQERIVGILDKAFAGLATAKANAEKNLQNARALFEGHLQSVFARRGPGLDEKRLDELCTFSSGGTPSKSNSGYWSGEIPWVSGRDMKSSRLSDSALHISQAAVDESATRMAPIGTLLILVRGMGLAHGAQIAELLVPCAFNQDIRGIHTSPGLFPRYLLFALRDRINSSDTVLSTAAHGTLKIDSDELQKVTIPVPALEKQQRIVAQIDALSVETQRLESLYQQNLVALDALKKSLLHQAFSGQL